MLDFVNNVLGSIRSAYAWWPQGEGRKPELMIRPLMANMLWLLGQSTKLLFRATVQELRQHSAWSKALYIVATATIVLSIVFGPAFLIAALYPEPAWISLLEMVGTTLFWFVVPVAGFFTKENV